MHHGHEKDGSNDAQPGVACNTGSIKTHGNWLCNQAQGVHGFSGGATVRLGGSALLGCQFPVVLVLR